MICAVAVYAQLIPYGNNPETGKYVVSGDARIYCETFGEGPPLLLLHGGYYCYISEFEMYLPELIKNFGVIAVATRGHGKLLNHFLRLIILIPNSRLLILPNSGHVELILSPAMFRDFNIPFLKGQWPCDIS